MLNEGTASTRRTEGVAALHKSLGVLDVVARLGGATAKEVAAELDLPLPTAYRLLHSLVDHEFLVHLRDEHRYELGWALGRLGSSLHRQIGVTGRVRADVERLHAGLEAAAYLAVVRGEDVVVAHVADSLRCRRAEPLACGFHEAAHATSYGKVLLATMSAPEVSDYLQRNGTPAWTGDTITDPGTLAVELRTVSARGVAWEHGEFERGTSCTAAPVRDAAGRVVGAVSVSVPSARLSASRAAQLEHALRDTAHHLGRSLGRSVRRTGSHRRPGTSAP